MAFYLMALWAIYGVMLVIYLYFRFIKKSKARETPFAILTIVAGAFLIVGFLTKDPLFSGIGLPTEYEWLAGLMLSGFSAWRFYLNPLKERVVSMESSFAKFVGSSESNFLHISRSLEEIKQTVKR